MNKKKKIKQLKKDLAYFKSDFERVDDENTELQGEIQYLKARIESKNKRTQTCCCWKRNV